MRTMRWRRASLLVGTAAVLGGCMSIAWPGQPSGSAPAPSLATIPAAVCHQATVTGILHLDAADRQVGWLETGDGERLDVVWPAGYHAEFVPQGQEAVLHVFDAQGRPFIGDGVTPSPSHVCDAGRPGVVLLMQTDQ